MSKLNLREDFLWGASSSAHQVEGNNTNDWTEWEKQNAQRLLNNLANFNFKSPELQTQALTLDNYISGKSANHYELFEEDFQIAKQLNHNAHRLSIEWSRIEPDEGKFNISEIEHYREVLSSLKEKGITPIVTLWHFTVPIWLSKKGGWENSKSVFYFERYAAFVTKELRDLVNIWITINEPEVYAGLAYFYGQRPPMKRNLLSLIRVTRNLIKAHNKVYETLKKRDKNLKIGISKHNIYFRPADNKLLNRLLTHVGRFISNDLILKFTNKNSDFIGLNYYFSIKVDFNFKNLSINSIYNKDSTQKDEKSSDMNWLLNPEGIYYVLKDLRKYKKPIYITECGLADYKDENREWYIQGCIDNIKKAHNEGVDIRSFIYWSLTDNFEWDFGFWPRFGLVEVDYSNSKRKIRNSAITFAEIIKSYQKTENKEELTAL